MPYANLDGVTGLTVGVGDVPDLAWALKRLLGDHELRERLGQQAKERALTQFTIPRFVDSMLAVYDEARAIHAEKQGRA